MFENYRVRKRFNNHPFSFNPFNKEVSDFTPDESKVFAIIQSRFYLLINLIEENLSTVQFRDLTEFYDDLILENNLSFEDKSFIRELEVYFYDRTLPSRERYTRKFDLELRVALNKPNALTVNGELSREMWLLRDSLGRDKTKLNLSLEFWDVLDFETAELNISLSVYNQFVAYLKAQPKSWFEEIHTKLQNPQKYVVFQECVPRNLDADLLRFQDKRSELRSKLLAQQEYIESLAVAKIESLEINTPLTDLTVIIGAVETPIECSCYTTVTDASDGKEFMIIKADNLNKEDILNSKYLKYKSEIARFQILAPKSSVPKFEPVNADLLFLSEGVTRPIYDPARKGLNIKNPTQVGVRNAPKCGGKPNFKIKDSLWLIFKSNANKPIK